MQGNQTRLIEVINRHDGCQATLADDGQLSVSSEVVRDGRVERVWETIPATTQAVRDWLGY